MSNIKRMLIVGSIVSVVGFGIGTCFRKTIDVAGLGYKTGERNGVKYSISYMDGVGPGIDWFETSGIAYLDYYRDCTLDTVCSSVKESPCTRVYDDENKMIPYFKPSDRLVDRKSEEASRLQKEFDTVKNQYFGGKPEITCRSGAAKR